MSIYDHHLNKIGWPHIPNATYQGHQPSGFEEDDFKGVLPYMGMAAILVM